MRNDQRGLSCIQRWEHSQEPIVPWRGRGRRKEVRGQARTSEASGRWLRPVARAARAQRLEMEARLREAMRSNVGHWLSPWTLEPGLGFEPWLCCLPAV